MCPFAPYFTKHKFPSRHPACLAEECADGYGHLLFMRHGGGRGGACDPGLNARRGLDPERWPQLGSCATRSGVSCIQIPSVCFMGFYLYETSSRQCFTQPRADSSASRWDIFSSNPQRRAHWA